MDTAGVTIFRIDFNIDPASLWDQNDADGRKGITENKYCQGYLKLMRDIKKRYGCFMDSCASGGGRNDLESMRRGVPLLRSDNDRTTASLRLSMTTSFNRWIPFCGANTKEKKEQLALRGISDPYVWRASYLPSLNVDSQFTQDLDQDFDILRFGLNEWKRINRYLLKEFYVLTPWHSEQERDSFTAYSFFDPESETGVLLAFRGEDCGQSEVSLCLPFTQGKDYILTDADSGKTITTKDEFDLYFECPRQARLLFVKRKNQI